jgi:uncharacterized protein
MYSIIIGENMTEIRVDKNSEISSVTRTDEGYLRIKAPVARSGIYKYRLSDGSIQREFIPPETLFNSDSLDTLKLKPVTRDHPSNFVDSKSFNRDAVGFTSEQIDSDKNMIYVDFLVTSQDGIDFIESGVNQLSPAYQCDVIKQSGITESGEHYDAIQRNRVYNHLALVDKARGGSSLSFKMDGEDVDCGIETNDSITEGDEPMAKSVRIDGVDHSVEDSVAEHIASLNQKAEKVDSLENEKITLEAKIDAKDAEIEALKQSVITDAEIQARVDSRVALISTAKEFVGEELKTDGDDLSVMEQVVLKAFPQSKEKMDSYEGESKTVYCKALFDAAIDSKAKDQDAKNREKLNKKDHSDKREDSESKFVEAIQNKWKDA